jgi:hypothetical protein
MNTWTVWLDASHASLRALAIQLRTRFDEQNTRRLELEGYLAEQLTPSIELITATAEQKARSSEQKG